MIQRIQSLYLFLAFVACVLTFFFPLASFWAGEGSSYRFYITGLETLVPDDNTSHTNSIPLIAINVIIGLMAIIILFLYKNRLLQMKMLRFNIMLNIVLILLIFFFYVPAIERATNVEADYTSEIGIYFPLICLVFLYLANRYIRKDEKLVRSADRLR